MTSPLPPSNVRGFENIEDRKRYGSDSLEPLASNDPGCLYSNDVFYPYPPCKQLLAIQMQAVANPLDASALKQITEIYETDIHPAIMDTILPSHGVRDQFRALHPLRTRFNVPDDQTPITLLFVFKRDSVSVEVAKGIVTNIQMLCSSSSWPKEIPVYVDVCQPKSQGDTRASTHGDGYREDLLLTYAFLFEDLRPIPGSSIGLGGRNKYRLTGTLCCFVKHGSKIYAITNDHVANPFDGTSSPYMYVTGDKKYRIISPSQSDQDEILERINNELAVCTPGTEQEVKLNADLRKAEGYHRNLGYVIATSGSVPPSPPNDFRQDWAIIECEGNMAF